MPVYRPKLPRVAPDDENYVIRPERLPSGRFTDDWGGFPNASDAALKSEMLSKGS